MWRGMAVHCPHITSCQHETVCTDVQVQLTRASNTPQHLALLPRLSAPVTAARLHALQVQRKARVEAQEPS